MQKVYLLLRNNQQTGPHTFEELLKLQLKTVDLIWVEGKSLGWRHPTEIEALKPFFITPELTEKEKLVPEQLAPSSVPIHASKKIFVSMPPSSSGSGALPKEPIVDTIEKKAEELCKKVEAYSTQNPVQTIYSRNLDEVEEDYTQWAYQNKTKKKSFLKKKYLAVTLICIFLLSGGWWLAGSFLASPSTVNKEKTVQQIQQMGEPAPVDILESEEDVAVQEIVSPFSDKEILPPVSDKAVKKETEKTRQTEKNRAPTEETFLRGKIIPQNKPIEKQEEEFIPEETEKEIIAEAPVEKKKTFKEKISDLLNKRKQAEENAESKPKKAGSNGERVATHRADDSQETPVLTDVTDQVEIKTNKLADSWMLGVKNLKLTLVNNSKLTINSAKVEVYYYSEQNNLLDKKILSFSNIARNKSQTVPAPNQRLTDHIEYKIISATGIDNAYANN